MRFLEWTSRSSRSILIKFWENFEKILKKFKKNWEENFECFQESYMKTLLGKIEEIRNWCFWYYGEILENFSEIISAKFGKSYEEILKNLWKNIGNTSHKL